MGQEEFSKWYEDLTEKIYCSLPENCVIEELYKKADDDANGKLKYEEFKKFI